MKILYIEDDLKEISSKIDLMEKEGFEVIRCLNPDKAFELIGEYQKDKLIIDLIIVDIMLPSGSFEKKETKDGQITGLLLLRKINQILKKPIPVIILTVIDDKKMRELLSKERNVIAYFVKPMLTSALIAFIKDHF